jgi:hypothetical protein
MNSIKKTARVAGLLYLLLVVLGPIDLMYVPRKVIVEGNAAATANNLVAFESLFRIGIVSGLVCQIIFVFLVLVLYRLFKGVNQEHAAVMVMFVLLQVPLAFLNEVNQIAALMLARGADFLSIFDKPQRDSAALFFLNLHDQVNYVSEIFWGLWLLPFGLLVFRSHFIPRILGIWLTINGFAYVAISFTGLLSPQKYDIVFNRAFPALLGEMAIMLWLLIMGAKPKPLADALPAPAGA